MKWCLLPIIAFASVCSASTSVVREAKIYAMGKTSDSPIFLQKTQLDTDDKGVTHEMTSIQDTQGKTVLTQESTFKGAQLIDQPVRQYQTGKAYRVRVDQDQIIFSTFDFNGTSESPSKDKPQMEKLEAPFLTGPVADSFLRSNWERLMSGDTIHSRFGVLELAETVGFKFWKVDSIKSLVNIRMKPSSIFIGMAVKSIDLLFDPSTHLMMEYIGRTPLRVENHGKLVPFDGEIVYK
jgi:hypothetical protein